MLADLNDRDTRQLWAAVNTSRNRSRLLPTSVIVYCPHLFHPCHGSTTPIPKVTPTRDYTDLRPISVTPILSRIYEKLLLKSFFLKLYPITSSMINLR
jgi:hypothetical protein